MRNCAQIVAFLYKQKYEFIANSREREKMHRDKYQLCMRYAVSLLTASIVSEI